MSFFSELKNTIKADFAGTNLSEDSDLVKIISKEISSTLKERFEVAATLPSPKAEKGMPGLALDGDQIGRLVTEIEFKVKKQIRLELDRGKIQKRIFKAIEWTITLVAGGIVGALFQRFLQ